MKQFLLLLLLSMPVLSMAQETINGTLMHDDEEREYILYVPAAYSADDSVPLLFNFHGYTSNASQQMFYGDFRPIADTANFILVHPEGLDDALGTSHFNVGWGGSTVDDIGFTEALLTKLSEEYNIDATRVYSTGMSNGGFMSYQLACQLSDKIAAIASVTGSMSPAVYEDCNPQHPMPVLEIHGTDDETVPYDGAIHTESIDKVIPYWIAYNNCETIASVKAIEDINDTDQSTVEHFIYGNGDNGVATELFKVTGGGHTWPGSFSSGSTNKDISASVEIWKFFSRYDINGLILPPNAVGVEQTAATDLAVQIYPNPTSASITITAQNASDLNYRLSTITGQLVLSGTTQSVSHTLDISELEEGMYLLEVEGKVFRVLKMGE